MTTLTGVLDGLSITADGTQTARYSLRLDDGRMLQLNEWIGGGLQMAFQGRVVCRHCAGESRRSFGGGYCYECFRTLARCDLCVLSPDRCHYAAGTCREPAWGEAFCMQPHRVYLANSSGVKVGITRSGREETRWLDQGAIQGLVILEADSRHVAGLAEVEIGRWLPDRTDWRKMLRADVPVLDLAAERDRLLRAGPLLPAGVRWAEAQTVRRLAYPLSLTEPPAQMLKLDEGAVRGNLLGMKGQYLVLSSGVFNVRQHAGYRVTVELGPPLAVGAERGTQLGLF